MKSIAPKKSFGAFFYFEMGGKGLRTIAVFFGGRSCEHEISVLTGMLTVKLLDEKKYTPLPVYLTTEGEMRDGRDCSAKDFADVIEGRKKLPSLSWTKGGVKRGIKRIPIDRAINCCHGGTGEGGGLAALLEWYSIPSVSPAMTEGALFQDKFLSKCVASSLGIPVAKGEKVEESEWIHGKSAALRRISVLGYPVIVKPNRLGSSIGIAVASDEAELEKAITVAFYYDTALLVEEYLPAKRDLNVAVRLHGKAFSSEVEEVLSEEDFLSFGEKYEQKRKTLCPAPLSEEENANIREYALRLYTQAVGKGIVRFDFILSGGVIYFNELNTVPGSLAYYLFSPSLSEASRMLTDELSRPIPLSKKSILTGDILQKSEKLLSNSCKIR